MIRAFVVAGIGLWLLAADADTAQAQVVQLPSFQQTGVSTTVVVPDRGSVYLGGMQRGAVGSTSSGVPLLGGVPGAGRLFRNRSVGGSLSGSSVGVSATIIDLREMDRQILGAAAAARKGDHEQTRLAEKAAFLSEHIARQKTK